MERMTRPTVVVDPRAAQFLGNAVDIRTMSDRLLDMVLNGPTLNGARKDALRQMIRQLYEALADYEVAIQRLGLFGQLFVEYRGCPRGLMGRMAGPLTVDELRGMAGEPVYIVLLDENKSWWLVIRGVTKEKLTSDYGGWFALESYGKTWLPYRRKPKEVPDHA